MKRLLLTLMLIACPLVMFGQSNSPQKVAIVDTQKILMSMPETKAMQTELDALMKKYEDTLVVMREEFQKKYQEYVAEKDTLIETIKVRREQELEELAKRIEDLNGVAQQDIQKKQQELFTPIQTKLRNAIEAVGNENGYAYIIDASAMLFIGNTGIDATSKVSSKLGIK